MARAGEGGPRDGGARTGYVRLRAQGAVSYTHLRAHETVLDLVCRLLLEKKKIASERELSYIHLAQQQLI